MFLRFLGRGPRVSNVGLLEVGRIKFAILFLNILSILVVERGCVVSCRLFTVLCGCDVFGCLILIKSC